MKRTILVLATVAGMVMSGVVAAQAPAAPAAPPAAPPAYGLGISLAAAKKAMAAAEAEAIKNNWPVAIAIVDSAAKLVMFVKVDNTQHGSVDIAIGKATTALNLRRPTKAEREDLAIACEQAADAVEAILADGADTAMARFNGLT